MGNKIVIFLCGFFRQEFFTLIIWNRRKSFGAFRYGGKLLIAARGCATTKSPTRRDGLVVDILGSLGGDIQCTM